VAPTAPPSRPTARPPRRPSRNPQAVPLSAPGGGRRPPPGGEGKRSPRNEHRRPPRGEHSKPRPRPPRWWRFRRLLFIAGFTVLALLAAGLFYVARLPLPKAPALAQTTMVFDASGHQVATFNGGQDRVEVSLRQVPAVLVDAVVSTEDRHFFSEGALNPLSTLRALWTDLRGNSLQGGSTITQQYVKNTYTGAQRTLMRKIKEAIIAEKVDRRMTKDQILQAYLNTIYFGRGAYGVEAASEAYFGENVSQLGLPQASLLAGLIRDPEGDDPAHNPAAARARQDTVLGAMVRDAKISPAQAARVEAMPMASYVKLTPPPTTGITYNGAAGDQYFLDYVRQLLIQRFGPAEVYGGGLRVYTTLEPALQQQAYDAVYRSPGSLDPARGDPAGALVAVDDQGRVRALVGGQNYSTSQVDLALGRLGGGSGRQAGSTFKAFLLAQLVKDGYSVESQVPAPPEVVVAHGNSNGTPWVVKNFDGESFGQPISVVDATALSVNTVFAQLVEKIGPAALEHMAIECGIQPSELGAYPSLTLGTADVSPLEMASGYSTFAAGGVHRAPTFITKVTTAAGKVLSWPATPPQRVLTAEQTAVVDYTLQQVVLRGTGTAASAAGVPVAGKTGTTDQSTDAWFVGYTPTLTTAVWMGYPQGSRPLADFRGYPSIQGGTIPAQIFARFLAAAVHSSPRWGGAAFPAPYSLGGSYLYFTPADEPQVLFPMGMGTTTTTSPPTTSVAPTTVATRPATTTPPTATTTTVPSRPVTPTTTTPQRTPSTTSRVPATT
jgi:membrane peptidoglycan carboxypeptidase